MKTVYVPMTADFLHHGHVNIIRQARTLGKVIVGLLTDEAIASYKGIPLLKYAQRKIIIENIRGVNAIIPQQTWDYVPNLRRLKPDFIVHGTDWKTGIQKAMRQKVIEALEEWGGRLVEPEYTREVSSTRFIDRLIEITTSYNTAQNEFIGKGSIYKLKHILSEEKPESIFLVTGKDSYEKCAAKSVSDDFLHDYKTTWFNDFKSNPRLEDIEKGLRIFNDNQCDFIIAIGGGSVIDVAKSINIFCANPGDPADYIMKKKKINNKGKTLVAIPTTAGSGSQATHFAVVYIGKTKYSLAHKQFILPDYAVVEPVFTESLPPYETACTGMDALGQAMESYWSIHSTTQSKAYAGEAISLVLENIYAAVRSPSYKAREHMALAAHLAGQAINISQTTACHAVSYPITSFFGVPHGHAVALTLPSMMVYNAGVTENDLLDERGVEYVKDTIDEMAGLLGAETPEQAADHIRQLMTDIHLETSLAQLGLNKEENIDLIIQNGFNPDRVKNNPRLLNAETLKQILLGS